MTQPRGAWRNIWFLGVAGGFAFWVANFAISLTPLAAEYRAALTISYVPMLFEALAGGLFIGLCVSYGLVRFFSSIPSSAPISKSLVLSIVALAAVTVLIEVPSKLPLPTSDALRYFVLAAVFNVVRLVALGVVIGWLYTRFENRARATDDGRRRVI